MARITRSAKKAAVEPRISLAPPGTKELSFSFRAECMTDVVCAFANILPKYTVMRSLTHYSTKMPGMIPDVDAVLVFRLYEGQMDRFIDSVETTLTLLSSTASHVINESINFTDEYDGSRTYTGKQRDNIMARVPEKLANMQFVQIPMFV